MYKKCNKVEMHIIDYRKNLLDQLILDNKKKLECLKNKIFNLKDIKDLLEFEIYDFNIKFDIKYNKNTGISMQDCKYDPSECCDHYERKRIKLAELEWVLEEQKKEYEQYLNVLDETKHRIENSESTKHIFIRFGMDLDDDIMCSFIDYSSFFENSPSNSFDVYILYGAKDLYGRFNNKNTFVYLEHHMYFQEGSIEIVDCLTCKNKIRVGHGSFALNTLLECCEDINLKLANSKKNTGLSQIEFIEGQIVPNRGMTYKEVSDFYESCGYIENGKLYRKIN